MHRMPRCSSQPHAGRTASGVSAFGFHVNAFAFHLHAFGFHLDAFGFHLHAFGFHLHALGFHLDAFSFHLDAFSSDIALVLQVPGFTSHSRSCHLLPCVAIECRELEPGHSRSG